MKTVITIIFIALFFSMAVQAEQRDEKFAVGRVTFMNQQVTLNVEIAWTKMQRAIGLMYRKKLALNKGMLFVFDQEAIQRVWMRNTYIPLDIIFISAKYEIISILNNIQPCIKEPCTIYDSTQKAKYMLEVNAGVVKNQSISVGGEVELYNSDLMGFFRINDFLLSIDNKL